MPQTIKSPYPGTFYRRPNPKADPYVSEGQTVEVGDVVGLIEIMKNFYEVTIEEAIGLETAVNEILSPANLE